MYSKIKAKNGTLYCYKQEKQGGAKRRIPKSIFDEKMVTISDQNSKTISWSQQMRIKDFLFRNCFSQHSGFYKAQEIGLPGTVITLTVGTGAVKKLASVLCFTKNTGMIYNVCTAKDEQRKGYAKKLVQYVLTRYGNHNAIKLEVWQNNQPAINLYLNLGFRIVSTLLGNIAGKPRLYHVMQYSS